MPREGAGGRAPRRTAVGHGGSRRPEGPPPPRKLQQPRRYFQHKRGVGSVCLKRGRRHTKSASLMVVEREIGMLFFQQRRLGAGRAAVSRAGASRWGRNARSRCFRPLLIFGSFEELSARAGVRDWSRESCARLASHLFWSGPAEVPALHTTASCSTIRRLSATGCGVFLYYREDRKRSSGTTPELTAGLD